MAQGDWTLVARSPGLAPAVLSEVREWAQQQACPSGVSWTCLRRRWRELGQREAMPYRPKVLAITGPTAKPP